MGGSSTGSPASKTHLYVLKYVRGYFGVSYKIGITNDPKRRRREHERDLNGFVKTISFDVWQFRDPEVSGTVENIATILYMANVGFDRVRGSCYDYRDQSGLLYQEDEVWKLDRSCRRRRVIASAYHAVATCANVCYNCHDSHLRHQCPRSASPKHYSQFRKNGIPEASPFDIDTVISPFMKSYEKIAIEYIQRSSRKRVSRAMRKLDFVKPRRYNLRPRGPRGGKKSSSQSP